MTVDQQPSPNAARLERTYHAPAALIWELWTTATGIEEWWAPDGFENRVTELELRPGGQLVYTMTATAPEQVEFMKNAGMPLSTESRKTFTEVSPPTRLAYLSLIDFVPDHEPYEHLTVVEITPAGDRTARLENCPALLTRARGEHPLAAFAGDVLGHLLDPARRRRHRAR